MYLPALVIKRRAIYCTDLSQNEAKDVRKMWSNVSLNVK